MKVDVSRDVQTNIHGAVDFKVSENAYKIFSMLSNYLYSDKEFAVLYELSANAHDEHVISGKADVPFDVVMPTRLDNKLRIRDYGRGLNEQDVERLLATYGESTKTGTNMAIGGWGIGFKSVAAVSSTWNVISNHNGTRTDYLIYINEQGIPSLKKIKQEATSETGIEIIIPIPPEKIGVWENNVLKVYKHFPLRPRFVNKAFSFREDEVVSQGSCWKLIANRNDYYGNGKMTFITSHREYSVDAGKVDSKYEPLTKLPLNVKFDIGELELSISREQLQYTKHTVDAINAKLEIVYNEIVDKINADLSLATDELDYRVNVHKVAQKVFGNRNNILSNPVVAKLVGLAINGKYGIVKIPEDINYVSIPITGNVHAYNGRTMTQAKAGWNCWKTYYGLLENSFDANRNIVQHLRVKVSALDRMVFWHKDVRDGAARIKDNYDPASGAYVIMFEQSTFTDLFKNRVKMVSSLVRKPRVKVAKQARSGEYYVTSGKSYNKVNIDFKTQTKVAYLITKSYSWHDFQDTVRRELEYLTSDGYVIIALKKNDVPPANVREVRDEIKHIFAEMKASPQIKEDAIRYMSTQMFNSYTNSSKAWLWKLLDLAEGTTGTWNKIRIELEPYLAAGRAAHYTHSYVNTNFTRRYNIIASMLGEATLDHSSAIIDTTKFADELITKYPLVKYAQNWDITDLTDYINLIDK